MVYIVYRFVNYGIEWMNILVVLNLTISIKMYSFTVSTLLVLDENEVWVKTSQTKGMFDTTQKIREFDSLSLSHTSFSS